MSSGGGDGVEMGKVESNYMSIDEVRDLKKADNEYEQITDPLDAAARAKNTAEIKRSAANVQASVDYSTDSVNGDVDANTEVVENGCGAVPNAAPADQPELQAGLDAMNLDATANPPKRNCIKSRAFMITLGIVGGGISIGGAVAIGYALSGAMKKADEMAAGTPPPAVPTDFDKLMEKLVNDWNALSDDAFFDSFKTFVSKMDGKSVETLFYMASYAARLAKAKNSSAIDQKQRTNLSAELVKNWDSNQSVVDLIDTDSILTVTSSSGTTTNLNRYDKLVVLSLASLRIIRDFQVASTSSSSSSSTT